AAQRSPQSGEEKNNRIFSSRFRPISSQRRLERGARRLVVLPPIRAPIGGLFERGPHRGAVMRRENHLRQRFVVHDREVQGQLGGDDSVSLVLDDALQRHKRFLLSTRQEGVKVVVLPLVVLQIERVTAQDVQETEGVVLERGF